MDCKRPLIQSELQFLADVSAQFGGIILIGSFAPSIAGQFFCGHGTFLSIKLDQIPTENGERLHTITLVDFSFLKQRSSAL